MYLGCKLRFSFDRLVAAGKACKAAWARQASEYGRHLEAQDLLEQGGGTSCAICQVPLFLLLLSRTCFATTPAPHLYL